MTEFRGLRPYIGPQLYSLSSTSSSAAGLCCTWTPQIRITAKAFSFAHFGASEGGFDPRSQPVPAVGHRLSLVVFRRVSLVAACWWHRPYEPERTDRFARLV